MGVSRRKSGKWQAQFVQKGVKITVGTFKTKNEARLALAVARGEKVTVSREPISKKSFWQRVKYAFSSKRSDTGTKKS